MINATGAFCHRNKNKYLWSNVQAGELNKPKSGMFAFGDATEGNARAKTRSIAARARLGNAAAVRCGICG